MTDIRPTAWVCDLDSTLCDTRQRHHLVEAAKAAGDWTDYSMACGADTPVGATVRVLEAGYAAGNQIIMLSARESAAMDLTEGWLREHLIPFHEVHLRPEGLAGHLADYKLEAIQRLERRFHIDLVLEDFSPTCALLRQHGYTVLSLRPPGVDESITSGALKAVGSEADSL